MRKKCAKEVSQLPVQVVENSQWHEGMGASIGVGIAAISAAPEKIAAVVLALCDQPFISSDAINQLVESYRATGKDIIASEYAGTLGAPALFRRKFFSELMNLKATAGAKQIIQKYNREVFPVPFAAGVVDIDTPKDYEELLTRTSPTPGMSD